jgi:hypothetical protein
MENRTKYAIVGVVALVALYFALRARSGSTTVAGGGGNTEIDSADSGDFISNVNLEVNPNAFAGLSNQYIPMYGMIASGVTGSLQQQVVNVNTINRIEATNTTQQVMQEMVQPPAPIRMHEDIPNTYAGWQPYGFASRASRGNPYA